MLVIVGVKVSRNDLTSQDEVTSQASLSINKASVIQVSYLL